MFVFGGRLGRKFLDLPIEARLWQALYNSLITERTLQELRDNSKFYVKLLPRSDIVI